MDTLSLSAAFIATVLLLSRIWDAVLDPLVGQLSDRVRIHGGRRKGVLLIAMLPLAALFLASLSPAAAHSSAVFVIITFSLLLAYSWCAVPYEAWGVDLCAEPHDRSRMTAWREGAGIIGMLCALAMPALLTTLGWSLQEALRGTAILCALAFVATTVAALWFVPEVKSLSAAQQSWDILAPFRMAEFRRLNAAFILSGIGAAIPATVVLFYVEVYLGSSKGPLFLLAYFIAGVLALPMWVKLTKWSAKRTVWVAALAVNTLAFACIYLVEPGQELLYGALVSLSGLGFGATLAIPTSIQIDLIEEAARRSGIRSEGQYFGLWSFSRKASAALGAFVSLQVLGLYGYSTAEGLTPAIATVIRDLYILAPCIFMLAAALVALRLPVLEGSR
ncbi:MAG: MFS transporter [Bdellovibrionota bacterium]|nr:MAG: MFS transporter [Bdellovibrionota bacterium]